MRLVFLLTVLTALTACMSTVPQVQAQTTVLTFDLVGESSVEPDAALASVETIQRRITAAGFGSATVRLSDSGEIEVRISGLVDIDPIVDLIAPVGELSFNMVDASADSYDYEEGIEKDGRIALPNDSEQGELDVVYVDPVLTGSDLTGTSAIIDHTDRPAIAFQLTNEASKRFERATSQNIGRNFAIVVDGRILSAPRIVGTIASGSGQISGSFTPQEAERVAVILRSGALPVRLKLLKSEVVAE